MKGIIDYPYFYPNDESETITLCDIQPLDEQGEYSVRNAKTGEVYTLVGEEDFAELI